MWLEMMFALAMGQEAPTSTQAAAATASPQTTGAVAEEPRRRGRRAEGVSCQYRARTGSVLRQNICTTSRRRNAEAQAAQDFVGAARSGALVTPSLDEGQPMTRTPG